MYVDGTISARFQTDTKASQDFLKCLGWAKILELEVVRFWFVFSINNNERAGNQRD